MNNTWKDKNEFEEYFNKYISLGKKKTLKLYRNKYGVINMGKWKDLKKYFQIVYSKEFLTIEQFITRGPSKTKLRKRNRRKKQKEKKIYLYRAYINSKKRKQKRGIFIRRYKNKCQCCKKEYLNKELNLHHHTYIRLGEERNNDLSVVCIQCHYEIHFENNKKVQLKECILRKRFEELKLY